MQHLVRGMANSRHHLRGRGGGLLDFREALVWIPVEIQDLAGWRGRVSAMGELVLLRPTGSRLRAGSGIPAAEFVGHRLAVILPRRVVGAAPWDATGRATEPVVL